mgnify:CR=1
MQCPRCQTDNQEGKNMAEVHGNRTDPVIKIIEYYQLFINEEKV